MSNRSALPSGSQAPSSPVAGAGPSGSAEPQGGLFVVGIGASAGGLEALEQFFTHAPDHFELALVLVLHLDPAQKDTLPGLLQHYTAMEVVEVRDGMRLKPDHVYVIAPNADLSTRNGVLRLTPPKAPRGLRTPIDNFFLSLAADMGPRCAGIVLSGMGADGLAGMRAIRDAGGATFAQDPSEAKFDSMPRAVVDAGLADVVATARDLPAKVMARFGAARVGDAPPPTVVEARGSGLHKVLIILRARTKHDFSVYKKSTLYRRIERRMNIHQINTIAGYVAYLQENPQEVFLLFKELLIGVTSFFRDPSAWEDLTSLALPELLARQPEGGALRAWVPGCSTGEEAYSLAMLFRSMTETLDMATPYTLQIFATDLDPDAIERARLGVYAAEIGKDIPPDILARYFIQEGNRYRVAKPIREMVVFATQNVNSDPPFTKIDLLCCRNLLIYLEPEQQRKLLQLFHYSLTPGGILFLGSAESIGSMDSAFEALPGKSHLFRRKGMPGQGGMAGLHPRYEYAPPAASDPPFRDPSAQTRNLQALAHRILLEQYAPAAVLADEAGEILFINGSTGDFLEPAAGKANWNIMVMAREGLRNELATAFKMVARKLGTVFLRNLALKTSQGVRAMDITVQAVTETDTARRLVMVTFAEAQAPSAAPASDAGQCADVTDHGESLRKDLEQARLALQTTIEDMQASQEELKSANEELQSTNEELQSTNEELTTSREEMQSLNEELQTLNSELQDKVDELSMANDDMENLLNSTDIATIFLDDEFRIRRYTPKATAIVKLIPGDVGRPLADLVSDLPYAQLFDEAATVLRTLVFVEKEIASRDGRWFMMRITPYRTRENRIDGVVLTFHDITAAKGLEAKLREANARLEALASDKAPGSTPQDGS